jgi:hypothetical protein
VEEVKSDLEESMERAKRIANIQKVTASIPCILEPVQILLQTVGIDVLNGMLAEMEDDTSRIGAWQLPQTMRRARMMKAKNKLFEKIIELAVAQQELIECTRDIEDENKSEQMVMDIITGGNNEQDS